MPRLTLHKAALSVLTTSLVSLPRAHGVSLRAGNRHQHHEVVDWTRQSPLSGRHSAKDVCDLTSVDGPVCFANNKAALQAPASERGLIGHWTFDESTALDSSGHSNHGDIELTPGPSVFVNGHSAFFSSNFVTVPASTNFQMVEFSVSLWVYVPEVEVPSDVPAWCPLIRKGVFVPSAREFSSSPALLYSPLSGQLRASVTTEKSTSLLYGEHLDSNGRIMRNRWMHVAVLHHNKKLLIYINGILDSVSTLTGPVVPDNHPLYIGGDPFTSTQCGNHLYIDDVRVYNRALKPHELQAHATLALGGADPSFVHLGCLSCSLGEAVSSCPSTRHICSGVELHTGAYQIARTLGWSRRGTHFWSASSTQSDAPVGLGLCCAGPPKSVVRGLE